MTHLSITATQSHREDDSQPQRQDNSQFQEDDDSHNLGEGRLQSMTFTIDVQGTKIVGLEATSKEQGVVIVEQRTKIVGLEATMSSFI